MTPPGVLSLCRRRGDDAPHSEGVISMAAKPSDTQDVFDVANWLDRANGRVPAPVSAVTATIPAAYVPRHRADVPVDSVA